MDNAVRLPVGSISLICDLSLNSPLGIRADIVSGSLDDMPCSIVICRRE
jgi:hypothetical protein